MKHQVTKFALTLLASLTLAACSSSGGSGDNNETAPAQPSTPSTQPSTPSAQPSTPSTQPSTPSTLPSTPSTQPSTPSTQPSTPSTQPSTPSTQPSTPSTQPSTPSMQPSMPGVNASGGAFIISGADDNVQTKIVDLTGYSATTLNVDGKSIPIGSAGIVSRYWSHFGEGNRINNVVFTHDVNVCCGRYSDVRFGHIESTTEDQSDYYFYNGNPTAAMPVSGTATYTGESISSGRMLSDQERGSAKFSVDFGAKTLAGSISRHGIEDIQVNAQISGNSFSGTAKSASLASEGTAQGKFYGAGAKELGGIIKANDNSWGGAFGASQ